MRFILSRLPTMTVNNQQFTSEKIYDINYLTANLLTFKVTRPAGFRFKAGQFARLGLCKESNEIIWRAYSLVNPPHADYLEFFAVLIADGEFSQLLQKSQNNEQILLDKQAFGYLTLDRFADGKDLWMLATGTGIAPFISILQDLPVWQQFERINLCYSVRKTADLAYQDIIKNLANWEYIGENAAKLRYLPLTSREKQPIIQQGRITDLLRTDDLEQIMDCELTTDNSRIMICGNPAMVQDSLNILKSKGFRLALTRKPGQIAVENYW